MSKLVVNEIENIAGENLKLFAACTFDGNDSDPITPDAEYNVDSVTKNGTGDYTINFTTNASSTNYIVSLSGKSSTPGTDAAIFCIETKAVDGLTFRGARIVSAYTADDNDIIDVIIYEV